MDTDRYRPLLKKLAEAGVGEAHMADVIDGLGHRSAKAKEVLFYEGDKIPDAYFVLSGYVKLYMTDEKGEMSIRFLAGPGHFAGCVEAMILEWPAQYTLEVISDSRLIVINQRLQDIIKGTVTTNVFFQEFVLKSLIDLTREKGDMLSMKATDRYLYFKKKYPQMAEKLPASDIANYIGVRPQSLSRIKQMLKNSRDE